MCAQHKRHVTQLYSRARPLEKLLSRFFNYQETAPGQFIACCPAHDDRNPSLSIKELDGGGLLLHCFAGCESSDVMASIGLTLADLYPERLSHHQAPTTPHQRRRYGQAPHLLAVLAHEALIVDLAAETIVTGGKLFDADLERLKIARNRIQAAYAVTGSPLPKRRARA